jgi:hypothetical protein
MIRKLSAQVFALPYESGDTIDREMYNSLTLGFGAYDVTEAPGAYTIKLTVMHADPDDTGAPDVFEQVKDPLLFLEHPAIISEAAGLITVNMNEEYQTQFGVANVDLDLVGCKRFIQIGIDTEAEGSACVVLGDYKYPPTHKP